MDTLYTWTVETKDNAWGTYPNTDAKTTVDVTKPTTTDNAVTGWGKDDVTVTLTASDGPLGSGVGNTFYCVYDSGQSACTPTPDTSGTSVPITATSGQTIQKIVRYYSVDNLGQAETAHDSAVIQIDKEAPDTTINVGTPNYVSGKTYVKSTTQFTLSANDHGGSNIVSTQYRIDSGETLTYTVAFTVTGAGDHTIYYKSTDLLGNVETEKSLSVFVDETPPVIGTITITPFFTKDTTNYISGLSNISASVNDTDSGVASCEYTLNGTDWVIIPGGACLINNVNTSAATSINIQATDNVGNGSQGTAVAVVPDTGVPSVNIGNVPKNWQSASAGLTINCTDAGSGCSANVGYKLYDAEPESCPVNLGDYTVGNSVIVSSHQWICAYGEDNVGNSATAGPTEITVDQTPPTIADGYEKDGVWVNSSQTITLTPQDTGGSEIKEVKYCKGLECDPADEEDILVLPYELTYSDEGIVVIKYQAWDNADNPSTIGSFVVQIDLTEPEAGISDAPESWTNITQEVSVTCSDEAGTVNSGCDTESFRYNVYTSDPEGVCSNDLEDYTLGGSVDITAHSWVCSYVKDNAGNEDFSGAPVEFTVDQINPTGELTGVPENWQNEDAEITLTSDDDDGSAVANSYLDAVPFGDTCEATTSYEDPLTISEYSTVCWKVVDVAGNVNEGSEDAMVDQTLPTSEITSPDKGSWFNDDFSVNIADFDSGGSELNICEYQINGGSLIVRTCSEQIPIAVGEGEDCGIEGESSCQVSVKSTDVATNESSETARGFSIDWTAPQTTLTPTPGEPNGKINWYITAPTITFSCSDNKSGCTETYLGINNPNPDPSGTGLVSCCMDSACVRTSRENCGWGEGKVVEGSTTCNPNPCSGSCTFAVRDGIHTLYYFSKDLASNQERILQQQFKVDTTLPNVDAGTDKTVNQPTLQDATVSDSEGSDIATYLWTSVSGPGETLTFNPQNTEDSTISADEDGAYVTRLTVTDNAGNSAYDDINFVWDTQFPIVTGFTSPAADNVYKNNASLIFTPSDPEPGTALTCAYQIGDGTPVGIFCTSDVPVNTNIASDLSDGRNIITLIVTDTAGNVYESEPRSFVFDDNDTLTVGAEGADFTTIQEAINKALPGDTIDVSAGTYEEDVVIDVEGLTLESVEPLGANIKGKVVIGGVGVSVSGVSVVGFEITDFTPLYSSTYAGIWLRGTVVADILIEGNRIDGTGIWPGLGNQVSGIETVAGTTGNAKIVNNEILQVRRGIYANPGYSLEITENTITAFKVIGTDNSPVVAHYNNLNVLPGGKGVEAFGVSVDAENNWWGVAVPDFSAIVSGNVDYDPWYLNEGMTILSSDVGKAIVYIDDNYTADGANDEHYWGFNAFAKIQEGINAVDEGGTVNVAIGNYTENLTIGKSLVLLGAGQETVTVTGKIKLNASDVTISEFTLTNSGTVIDITNSVSQVLIDTNTIYGNDTGRGILFDKNKTFNVTISNNKIHNLVSCIYIGNAGSGPVIIDNNEIYECKAGIGGLNYATVTSNYFHDNIEDIGITDYAHDFTVKSNKFNSPVKNYGVIERDFSKNWWGSETGPTHSSNAGGTGSAVSDNVNFRPWCINEACTPPIDEVAPTVALSYDKTFPVKAGALVITATYPESILNTPKININQPGTVDISEQDMTVVPGTDRKVWNYSYTVTTANGGVYLDGVATVSLADAWDSYGNIASAPSANTTFTIDTTPPVVSALSISPFTGTAKIGDTITLNITADAVGYTASAITVNGVDVKSSFTDLTGGNYRATYTVAEGNSDVAAGAITASVVLKDSANNENVPFTTVTTNTFSVDANTPVISTITSDATGVGWLKVGNTITFALTPATTEPDAIVSGSYNGIVLSWSTANGGVTYTATYTVAEGNTDQLIGPLQITGVTITDAAGNVSAPAGSSNVAKTIDAHTPTLVLGSLFTGQTLTGGRVYPINWTAADLNFSGTPVKLEYSIDVNDGATWRTIVASTENDGVYSWSVPTQINSSAAKIKITATDLATNNTSAQSNVFTIAYSESVDNAPPVVTLNSPNGGESWQGGSSHVITWTATDNVTPAGSIAVKLEYSTDGSAHWTEITASTENDGAYLWTVPDSASTNALVKVTATDAASNSGSDLSNAVFTITAQPPAQICTNAGGGQWTCNIALGTGWNLVSLPVVVSNTAISTVLSGVSGNMDLVQYYNGSAWVVYKPGVTNDLTTIEDGKGYWIFMNNPATLTVTGTKAPAAPAHSPVYNVLQGWNLIGFKSTISQLASTYLQTLLANSYTLLNASNENKNSGNMDAGKGYWLWMNNAGSIVTYSETE